MTTRTTSNSLADKARTLDRYRWLLLRERHGVLGSAVRFMRDALKDWWFGSCAKWRLAGAVSANTEASLWRWGSTNAGRLHPDKDQATLIRGFALAAPQLPPASVLAIMGSGRLEAELKRLASELGVTDRVRFLGQVPQGRRYFSAFDLFALTSDHEPFGMVLLEAMAAGVPLICSDCGGGREVVEGVGRLFPLGAAAALGECLEEAGRRSSGAAEQVKALMRRRLHDCFSDAAAARRFWQLPLLTRIAG